jgi:calcium-dependent protein kinase
MGSCCSRTNVMTSPYRKTKSTRANSILLEHFSKQTDYKKKYEFLSILGNGGYGKVRLFRDRSCRDLKFAIKTVKKDYLNQHNLDSLVKEVKILIDLDHPNIVKYFETYEDEHYIHIVMEYIPGDHLFKVITNRRYNNFCEKNAAEIISCLFEAVNFLHTHNIVHRDIKPENILFSLSGDYNSLKLIDFGLSTAINTKERYRVGSPYYMAPEVLTGNFVFSSDVWSIGVILFVMMTGTYPFNGKTQQEVFGKITKGVYDVKLLDKQKCSSEVKDLIKKLLVLDHTKRLGVMDALQHPWLTQFKENKDLANVISDDIVASLVNFTTQSLLQKEILFYLAKISSEKDITKLKQAFLEFDKDKSGTIDSDEIATIFRMLGKDIDQVSLIIIL